MLILPDLIHVARVVRAARSFAGEGARAPSKTCLTPAAHSHCYTAYCLLLTPMSTIQQDFDRIALVSPDGAAHNDHYHNFQA
jgi:hypothetical protein